MITNLFLTYEKLKKYLKTLILKSESEVKEIINWTEGKIKIKNKV